MKSPVIPGATPTEGRLVARARAGDGAAFGELVRRYDPGLRGLAFRLLEDRDRMDDVLQDAYLKAYRALPGFRGRSAFGTWLYRIAYNACLDALRAGSGMQPVALDDADERADPTADTEEGSAARDLVARGLAALPPEQRATLLLVDQLGFSYSAAAAVLGLPEGTVASRLHVARRELKRHLSDERRPSA